jgi:glycogen operon protein
MIHLRLHFDEKGKDGQTTLDDYLSKSRIEWHGVEIGKPDWGSNSHSLALSLHNLAGTQVRYVAINAYWKPLEFALPPVADGASGGWLRFMDTYLPSQGDIVEGAKGSRVGGSSYRVNPRSIVLLHCDHEDKGPATTNRRSKF